MFSMHESDFQRPARVIEAPSPSTRISDSKGLLPSRSENTQHVSSFFPLLN